MHVKILCLGILRFGDATGYEIRKMTQEGRFGHFIEAGYGSIYPALLRLEKDGLVVSRKETQAGRPDRKIYSINDAGHAAFITALHKAPRDDVFKSEFLFVMLCANLVSRSHVEHLIDMRLEHLNTHMTHMRDVCQECDHNGSQFVLGYGLAIYEAEYTYLVKQRRNLENWAGQAMSDSGKRSDLGNAAE